jgi:glycosyltransferase involved in cell wall biosynthesis
MRICLYTTTALPKLGGQEAVVDALARQFTEIGHEAIVLAPRPRRPLRARDSILPYIVRRHPRFFSTRDFVSWYRHFLRKLHARYRFDIVHCHDVYPTGYLAALCKPGLGVPLVITSHGGDVRENNPRLEKRGIPQRMLFALRTADALVSIAPFTEKNFRRMCPDARRIVTIPNGIDLMPYRSLAPRPPALDPAIQSKNFVLFIGRLAQRKGVDVLLEAMEKTPTVVELVIAGTGEAQEQLQAMAQSMGLQNRVHFVGRVEGDVKLYLLQNALAVAIPSRVWEAFPLVVLESFAAGRPVIGSRIPGIADLVEEGKTGILIPQEEPAALAQAMQKLFENPDIAERMGTAARDVAQNYSWESIAEKHIRLYRQLCESANEDPGSQDNGGLQKQEHEQGDHRVV